MAIPVPTHQSTLLPTRVSRVVTWLTLAVLLAHALSLAWLASRWRESPAMPLMGAPLLTRTISQQAPAPTPTSVAQQSKPVEALFAPAQPAITTIAKTTVVQTPTVPPPEPPPVAIPTPTPPASEPTPPTPNTALASGPGGNSGPPQTGFVVGPVAPVFTPQTSTPQGSVTDVLASWPGDTRLTYAISESDFVRSLSGKGTVLWQKKDNNYQVGIELDASGFPNVTFTSAGSITVGGLRPSIYEEKVIGRRRVASFGSEAVTLNDGRQLPRPAEVQDTASQFVELSQRFATGRIALTVGNVAVLSLARPGGIDEWTYDITEEVILKTPRLGSIKAFHLKPRPIANPRGTYSVEMWFAPTLQYLPVKIRLYFPYGSTVSSVDLLIDKIEQQ